MGAIKKAVVSEQPPHSAESDLRSGRPGRALAAALTVAVMAAGYVLIDRQILLLPATLFSGQADRQARPPSPDPASDPAKTETRLTREAIDLLLNSLDVARRQKDADGILRHIAPDAMITIHMKQGAQQQIATLTRDEYRHTLHMSFAFPSANDFTRVSTRVTLAPDERSAKIAIKSTETLHQERRDIIIEGEETLLFTIRNNRPTIVSLEQVVPGDST